MTDYALSLKYFLGSLVEYMTPIHVIVFILCNLDKLNSNWQRLSRPLHFAGRRHITAVSNSH